MIHKGAISAIEIGHDEMMVLHFQARVLPRNGLVLDDDSIDSGLRPIVTGRSQMYSTTEPVRMIAYRSAALFPLMACPYLFSVSGIIDHSSADIGAGNRSHQFAIVHNWQAPNLFLNHDDSSLSNFVVVFKRDGLVNNQGINGTIHNITALSGQKI